MFFTQQSNHRLERSSLKDLIKFINKCTVDRPTYEHITKNLQLHNVLPLTDTVDPYASHVVDSLQTKHHRLTTEFNSACTPSISLPSISAQCKSRLLTKTLSSLKSRHQSQLSSIVSRVQNSRLQSIPSTDFYVEGNIDSLIDQQTFLLRRISQFQHLDQSNPIENQSQPDPHELFLDDSLLALQYRQKTTGLLSSLTNKMVATMTTTRSSESIKVMEQVKKHVTMKIKQMCVELALEKQQLQANQSFVSNCMKEIQEHEARVTQFEKDIEFKTHRNRLLKDQIHSLFWNDFKSKSDSLFVDLSNLEKLNKISNIGGYLAEAIQKSFNIDHYLIDCAKEWNLLTSYRPISQGAQLPHLF
ncbi:hypothetical protein GEMRC1_004197 [Eukaryota sp. GEM-RC1]